MEFKEVADINKQLIVKVKDLIHFKGLLSYMWKFPFTVLEVQGIERDIENHGDSHAAIKVFDIIRRKPNTFPKFVAAVHHSGQDEVYQIFMKEIRKYFTGNKDRLQHVLTLIETEKRDLHDDDIEVDGDSALGPRVNVNQAASNLPSSNTSIDKPQWTCRQSSAPPHKVASDSLLYTRGGACGVGPCRLENRYAGEKISSLDSNVYDMLGKVLEERNWHGNDDKPWWKYMISTQKCVSVSRKDQKDIEKDDEPGAAFLDVLDDRGCTLQDLESHLNLCQITKALDILYEHQNQVLPERKDDHQEAAHRNDNDNNLNTNQGSKSDTSKMLNILPSTPGDVEVDNSAGRDSTQPGTNVKKSKISPGVQLLTQTSQLSQESNSEGSLSTIEDQSIKGTTAVSAHGDPHNKLSQCTDEQEANNLRQERLQAMEGTSLTPVPTDGGSDNRDIRTDGPSCNVGNAETMPTQSEVGMVGNNIPEASANRSSNSPLPSQARMEHSNDDSIPHGISPRSLTTFEHTNYATNATYVDPSLDITCTQSQSVTNPDEASDEDLVRATDENRPELSNAAESSGNMPFMSQIFSLASSTEEQNDDSSRRPVDNQDPLTSLEQIQEPEEITREIQNPLTTAEGVTYVSARSCTTFERKQAETGAVVSYVSMDLDSIASRIESDDVSSSQTVDNTTSTTQPDVVKNTTPKEHE